MASQEHVSGTTAYGSNTQPVVTYKADSYRNIPTHWDAQLGILGGPQLENIAPLSGRGRTPDSKHSTVEHTTEMTPCTTVPSQATDQRTEVEMEDGLKPCACEAKSTATWYTVFSAIPMGLAFGMAMEYGLVTLPETIRMQFSLTRFVMLKMFLAASVTSTMSFVILAFLAPKRLQNARGLFFTCGDTKSLTTSFVGGGILGAGMAIGGACPGMVIVQLGAFVDNSYFTFLGALLGAAFYGVFQPYIQPFLESPVKYRRVEDLPFLKGFTFPFLATCMAAILSIVIVLLEVFFPWASKDGVNPELPTLPSFSSAVPSVVEAWNSAGPPILSGVVIGSLQIPAVLFLGDTLGSSSAYMFLVSQVLVVPSMQNYFKHLDGFRRGVDNLWQVLYLGTAFGGSFLASKLMGVNGAAKGLDIGQSILGGFLMLFGSRIASGCTSGHGISGMSLLSLPSMFAVGGMFVMGFIVGLSYNAIDSDLYNDARYQPV